MKPKKRNLCVLMSLFFLLLFSLPAQAKETGEEEDVTLSPYFYIKDSDPRTDRLPLKSTKVSTTINGTFAETYITQTYANEGENPINASYIFPASTKAAVHGMKMQIGDEIITAKIKEREEARTDFEEAKSKGKSASLLEEQRPNVFSMDVANIMPGDTICLELHYTEMLSSTEGTYQFVFPTVVGPRYASPSRTGKTNVEGISQSDDWVSSPYLLKDETPPGSYDISVRLSTGVPIAALSSSSHTINVSWDNDSTAQVTLADPSDYAGDRDFILDYQLTGEEVNCGLMLAQANGEKVSQENFFQENFFQENFFLLSIQPPEHYEPEDIPPREYIFVLDVSGSMEGYPLDTAKDLIRNLVSNLRETDCFNLILFSDSAIRLSPESLPATQDNILRAVNLIDEQEGGGGTELMPALEKALAIPQKDNISRSIITITDGYISGEKEIFHLVNRNLSTTSFFSFGIGDAVNRYLIDGIAQAGAGEAFVVTDSEEAAETAERFRTYVEAPLLTDIQITYDGFDVYDVEPPVQSTLFAQKPITVFGKWKGSPSGTIRITGKNGTRDYVREIRVADVVPSQDNSALPYLWARTRVERLSNYGVTSDELADLQEAAVKREITAIGLKYSMLTPYTSFIAVSETVRNDTGEGSDVDQPLPLPSRVSHLAVGSYTCGSEPGSFLFFAGMFLFILIRMLLWKCFRKTSRQEVSS